MSEHDSHGSESLVQRALFESRTVMIFGGINMELAEDVVSQLLALSAKSDAPIKVLVNSPGGHVESGDSIHDVIRFIKPKVQMIGTGWVASAGAHIFLGAEKANRYCLPNTRFLLHQPSGGVGGQYSDIEIEVNEMVKMRDRLNKIIARETGQSIDRVVKDTDRNYWMGASEALEYGVVGKIVSSVGELK